MAGITIRTAAENFKGQLRTAEKQSNDAIGYAKGLRGVAGSQELQWAAEKVLKAVAEARQLCERILSRY